MNLHYKREKLPNGLQLITAPLHDTKAVTVLILVAAGSRYEDKRTNGVAHFLEHMFFKGTTKRPSTLEISKELDALGADYNAFTGEEYTGFYVRVAGADFHQAFDIITDMLLNPLFQVEEIEREKGVIVEELNMYEDTPMRIIHDHAKQLVYGDTPLGRNIGGTKETVTKFDRQDFINFRTRFYQPNNLVVAIAGMGEATSWKQEVIDKLGHLEGTAEKTFNKAKDQGKGPHFRLVTKKTDQAHLVLSFRGFPRTDPRRPIASLLLNILGGTMSSRLFIEVRERRGLAYYVRGGSSYYRDTGDIMASAGVQVAKIDEAIQVILNEFRRLKDTPITEEELDRAKKNLRGSLYLGLEDSMSVADYLGEQALLEDEIEQPEEVVAKREVVTRKQIQALAAELIDSDNLYLTILGPYDNQARFEKILKNW
jgi:predicted Zn-dependent peptidase